MCLCAWAVASWARFCRPWLGRAAARRRLACRTVAAIYAPRLAAGAWQGAGRRRAQGTCGNNKSEKKSTSGRVTGGGSVQVVVLFGLRARAAAPLRVVVSSGRHRMAKTLQGIGKAPDQMGGCIGTEARWPLGAAMRRWNTEGDRAHDAAL